ncbi:efflux transporter outer membrane subunit [Rhizosaccharibacter radicis]|uniref:Efflux transporter outer membrane subunit n=1 Tax=Rhizosaccharibacter radicis TaxID=2782605 RepID=A0ABT1VVR5_9PROT|nr:efflux transporter outer membrane subunit [Acetobacteraceae bacterium KSS12]
MNSSSLFSKRAVAAGRAARLAAAAAVLMAGGCEVGPDFRRPPSITPGRVTTDPLPARTAASKVAEGAAQTLVVGRDIPGDWWRLFRSPVLDGLVRDALRDNPSLQAAEETLTQARELRLAQEGTLFPNISGLASRSRQEQPISYEGGAGPDGRAQPAFLFSQYTAQLNLSYTLDVWGGLRRAVEQTGATVDYRRFQLEAAQLALTAGVVTSAILLASLQEQIDAQQQLIGFEQKQLDTVRQQFELGGATGTDLATQQAQVAQAQTVLVPLQTQAAQARDQLAAYTGRPPSALILGRIDLSNFTLPEEVPVSVPAALLDQRPDIRAQEALLHQQNAALGVSIAQRLPNFTLSASVGSSAADVHQLFSPTTGLWSVVNQVTQPLFDAGQLLHQQRAQAAATRAAAASWRDTVVRAFQNTADVLVALTNDAQTLRYALDAQLAAQRGLSLASLQFKLGGVSYLSVLNAQQIYQNTVITLVRARAARLADTVALFQALGGGWWHRDDLPAPPPGLLSSPLP